MAIAHSEIQETIRMVELESLDIRTVTMGISLRNCADSNFEVVKQKVYDKIVDYAGELKATAEQVAKEYGIPIINKRVSITPIAEILGDATVAQAVELAQVLDQAAKETDVDFIGGYSALVQKGVTNSDVTLLNAIPQALATTERVCSSVAIGSTRAGINMDAVSKLGEIIKETAELTKDQQSIGCAKFVAFCNLVEDNPFMAGA